MELYPKIISNPPYSLKFDEQEIDCKKFKYGIPNSSYADYLFIQSGLSRLSEDGIAAFILPHGILFRGNRERKIREALIKDNVIDAVIGLPNNLFLATQIPVFILILKKNKKDDKIFFADASKEFEKNGKQNILTEQNIEKICDAYKQRLNIDKFSRLVSFKEIQENDYNLNIPRYVDTYEPEPLPDMKSTLTELINIEREIKKSYVELFDMSKDLQGEGSDNLVDSLKEILHDIYKIEKNS